MHAGTVRVVSPTDVATSPVTTRCRLRIDYSDDASRHLAAPLAFPQDQ